MSTEWLQKMYAAAESLNDDAVLELIKVIPLQYSQLADQLTILVDRFQLDKIAVFVETLIGSE